MSITSLVAPSPQPTRLGAEDAPRTDDLVLDALLSEEETLPVRVTEFPVEDGSTVSDNVIPFPETLNIQGVISDSPLYDVVDVLQNVTQGKAVNGVLVGQNINRAKLAWDKLRALRDGRKLLRIATPRGVFTSYAITSLGRTKNAATGEVLSFTLACKRVNKVPLQFVTRVKETATGQTQPKTEKSDQTPAEPAAPAKARATLLKKLTDGLGATTSGSGLVPGGGGLNF